MPARTVSLFVVCASVCFAGAHRSRAQEATSANLPDQFQTGEMIQIHKPKKKKAESTQTVATAPKQNTAPVPEQTPAAEKVPAQFAPAEGKSPNPIGALPQCHQFNRRSRPKRCLPRKCQQ